MALAKLNTNFASQQALVNIIREQQQRIKKNNEATKTQKKSDSYFKSTSAKVGGLLTSVVAVATQDIRIQNIQKLPSKETNVIRNAISPTAQFASAVNGAAKRFEYARENGFKAGEIKNVSVDEIIANKQLVLTA